MVNSWNSTFGKTKNLDYTVKVERSLRRLRPFVNLELPNWKELIDETVSIYCLHTTIKANILLRF
jgi:hypothetical protein